MHISISAAKFSLTFERSAKCFMFISYMLLECSINTSLQAYLHTHQHIPIHHTCSLLYNRYSTGKYLLSYNLLCRLHVAKAIIFFHFLFLLFYILLLSCFTWNAYYVHIYMYDPQLPFVKKQTFGQETKTSQTHHHLPIRFELAPYFHIATTTNSFIRNARMLQNELRSL